MTKPLSHDHEQSDHEGCNHSALGHSHSMGPALLISLIATVIFVAIEATVGYIAHSLALMSDAGHNFSDALSLGLSAYAVWVARRPANSRKTFGYHRVAILTALLNSAALAVIAVGIIFEAIHSFQHPVAINSTLMVWTAAIALVVNSAIVWALHGGAQHSLNIRATYVHMATDVISSILVVISALVIRQTGLTVCDPIVSLVIAAIIIVSCWKIVREATDILLEATPKGLDVDGLAAGIATLPQVRAVHDLHVWSVSDGMNYLSCHVEVADTHTMTECAVIMRTVNELLFSKFAIAHTTIQMEMAGACVNAESLDPLYCGGTMPREHVLAP